MPKKYLIDSITQSFSVITPELLKNIVQAALIFGVGYIFFRILSMIVGKITRKKLSQQSVMILQKATYYSGLFLLVFVTLHQLGIRLSALLGAAGIVGIAIGFASQTSVSNIISGLFLIGEKPFEVGDIIQINGKNGTVLSIDLLSIKLRTFDNHFIRIPNETIIKSEVTTITRFPIRRMDIKLEVAYRENIRKVCAVLKDIADTNPYILDEPEPFIMFDGFATSGLSITCGFWFVKEDWKKAKSEILLDIKERFDEEGIEFPFPHRTLYAGSGTVPFPVTIVEKGSVSPEETDQIPKGDTSSVA